MAAVADQIDDDVGAKLGAIFGGDGANMHDGIGIFGVYVKDGNGLAFGDVGGKARRVFLRRARGETN